MRKVKLSLLAALSQQIADQRKWIEEHGGSLHGYVLRYGSIDDTNHYGDGGEAIFAADQGALDALLVRAQRAPRQRFETDQQYRHRVQFGVQS